MIRFVFIVFLSVLSSSIQAVQVSNRTPSFDCSKSSNQVEKLICAKESYRLKELDNRTLIEYKTLLTKVKDKKLLKKQQLGWLKKRNLCKTKECLANSYKNCLVEIRKEAISVFEKVEDKCFTSVYDAIFKEVSLVQGITKPEKNMEVFHATSNGRTIDMDLDGKADPILMFNGNQESCTARNCWSENKVFLDINGCYKSADVSFMRSGFIKPQNLEKRILSVYNQGNYPKNIAVLTSYDVNGCAGSSGTRYYSALNTTNMTFETFVSIEYDCDANNDYKQVETRFWSKDY